MKGKIVGSQKHIVQYDLRNHKGRCFITSDIHGYFDLMHKKMEEVAFDTSKDILFVAGDILDRGADSIYALDYITEPWFISVLGNHCQMFVRGYEEKWNGPNARCLYENGGEWIDDMTPAQLTAIYEVFKTYPIGIELILPTETIGIVHASVPYNDWNAFKNITKTELEWHGESVALWDRQQYDSGDTSDTLSIDKVYHGHTPTSSREVEQRGNRFYIDLGSFYSGNISWIRLQ